MKPFRYIVCALIIICCICSVTLAAELPDQSNEEPDTDFCTQITLDIADSFSELTETVSFAGTDFMQSTEEAVAVYIPYVGMSSFILFSDDIDSESVEYASENIGVALAYDGRILATGIGTTLISVTCNGNSVVYQVTVDRQLEEDYVLVMENVQAENETAVSSSKPSRSTIAQRAIDMVYLHWTPEKDVTGWKDQMTFYAGSTYTGIPYSQTSNQVNDDEFLDALENASDFYANTAYTGSSTVVGPRYGNDCSGFVSECWFPGTRYTTSGFQSGVASGEFTSYGYNYENLDKGDALLKSGHIILVTQNWEEPPSGSSYTESYCVCYEQTPCYAVMTMYTYTQLQSAGYIGISYVE